MTERRFQLVKWTKLENISTVREARRSEQEVGFWRKSDTESVELTDLTGIAFKLEA